MQGEFIKGAFKDVIEELEKEAKRCKGMPVGKWLKLRKLEKLEAEQLGMDVKGLRYYGKSI